MVVSDMVRGGDGIEAPKFRALQEKKLREIPLHRWMMFMEENLSVDVLKELVDMDPAIKKVEEKLEYLSSDPATIELYRRREDSEHEKANLISSAKADGRVEGRVEGRLEGRVEGRAEGISEGFAQGRIQTAIASLKEGLSIELVSRITGLSMDELEEIQEKYSH
jgi:predicted transposase/invertase (TIGR01784 family)